MIKAEIHPLTWAVRGHHPRRLWQEQFQVCTDVWVELGSNGRRCAGGNKRALTPAGLAGAGGQLLRGEGGSLSVSQAEWGSEGWLSHN